MSLTVRLSKGTLRAYLLLSAVLAVTPLSSLHAETDEDRKQREQSEHHQDAGQKPAPHPSEPAARAPSAVPGGGASAPTVMPQRVVPEQARNPAVLAAPAGHGPEMPAVRPPDHVQPMAAAPHAGDNHPRMEEEHVHFVHDEQWHHEFHERDIHRLPPFEIGLWRAGGWHNGWHNGRFGWWWLVDGIWYFYDQPIYPYPEVISDVVYVDPDLPQADVEVPAPSYLPPQPGSAPALYYYCSAPAGVYPTVPRCSVPFQPVYYYCDQPAGYYPSIPQCALPFRMVPAQQ